MASSDKLKVPFFFLCLFIAHIAAEVEQTLAENLMNITSSEVEGRSKDSKDLQLKSGGKHARTHHSNFEDQSPFVPHRAPMGFQEAVGSQFPIGSDGNFKNGKFMDNTFHMHRDDEDDSFQGGNFNGHSFDPFKELQQQQDVGTTGSGNKIVNINNDNHNNIATFPEHNNFHNFQEHSMNIVGGDHRPLMLAPRPINAQPGMPYPGFMGGFGGHMMHPNFPMHPYRLVPPTPMFRLHPPMFPRFMYNPFYRQTAMRRQKRQTPTSEEDSDEDVSNNNNNGNSTTNFNNAGSVVQILAQIPREFVRQVAQQATSAMAEDFADFLEDLSPFK